MIDDANELLAIVAKLQAGVLEGDERILAETRLLQPVTKNIASYAPRRAVDPPADPWVVQGIQQKLAKSEAVQDHEHATLAVYRKWLRKAEEIEQENIRRLASVLFAHRTYVALVDRSGGAPDLAGIRDGLRRFLRDAWNLPVPPVGALEERETADRVGKSMTHGQRVSREPASPRRAAGGGWR